MCGKQMPTLFSFGANVLKALLSTTQDFLLGF